MTRAAGKKHRKTGRKARPYDNPQDMEPDWETKCMNCGAVPVVPATGMCGPCTFGEAETIGGNW